MREVEELLRSVVTFDDGLKIISNLENKLELSRVGKKKGASDGDLGMLDEFKGAFYKMQVVNLTLAINPDLRFLTDLQEWFSDNLGETVIFDLKVDPQIIGGATIICRDHFRDCSLAGIIEKVTKNKEEINEKELNIVPSATI